MKATRDRTSQFTSSSTPSSSQTPHQSILSQLPPSRTKSPFAPQGLNSLDGGESGGYEVDRKGKGRGDYLALDMESAENGRGEGGAGAGGFQQMQLVEEQVRTCF